MDNGDVCENFFKTTDSQEIKMLRDLSNSSSSYLRYKGKNKVIDRYLTDEEITIIKIIIEAYDEAMSIAEKCQENHTHIVPI